MFDLRSRARQRLLAYYFTNPAARHHLRDLADRLNIDPSNLSRELRRLEGDGLFRSEVSGRQKLRFIQHELSATLYPPACIRITFQPARILQHVLPL